MDGVYWIPRYYTRFHFFRLLTKSGELYIRMLKCLIVPLVSLSLVGAMSSLGTMKEGKVGFYAVSWYILTTVSYYIFGKYHKNYN